MSDDRRALQAALRQDLTAFVEKVFDTISPEARYLHNWHIEACAYQLERCLTGENTRLLITQPPRSLKSICSSVAFVAWALGHSPALRFICVSYSDDLAAELARQFRKVVHAPWYQTLFPKMRVARDTAQELTTSKGGGRLATSIDGTLTGRGGDIIIIDDPLKAGEASSKKARDTVNKWYADTLVTRLNDKERGAIIVVMQRLHEDDLGGYLLAQGGWYHLNLPAIAVVNETIRIGPHANDIHHRREDDLLHEAREPQASLDRIKADLGSLAFSAQYQQQPVPLEGNLVRREWFRWYKTPPDLEAARIVQSWDIAATTGEQNDYSVCTSWAVVRKNYYLIDVWRGRLEFPDLKRKVIALQQEHRARTVLIERAGLGLSLVQDLDVESLPGFPNPVGITPKGDKLMRMEAESARIEAGHVYLPEDAPWLDGFLNELMAFPNGRHDDQVDSLSQFLRWSWNESRFEPTVSIAGAIIIYP